MEQAQKEEKEQQRLKAMNVMLSPSAREAMAMEKRRKALYPSQVVSANMLNL